MQIRNGIRCQWERIADADCHLLSLNPPTKTRQLQPSLPMPGSLHAPSLWLLHLCPCRDTPKTQTSGSAGRLQPKYHQVSPCLHHTIPPHASSLLQHRACHSSGYTILSLRAFCFGTLCFHSKARFLWKGPSSRGCYSQAGFDKFFLSPPSSSRLRGKRSPSESDLEASPWSKTESFSKKGEGPPCTDTPLRKRIPVSNTTPTGPLNFVPRCNITFHKMTHAHIYTTD